MILFEVNAPGVTIDLLERNTPWSVHMKAVAPRRSSQRVKVETRDLQVAQHSRVIQGVQPAQGAPLQILPHPGTPAGLEQLCQPFVPEVSDHRADVRRTSRACKAQRYRQPAGPVLEERGVEGLEGLDLQLGGHPEIKKGLSTREQLRALTRLVARQRSPEAPPARACENEISFAAKGVPKCGLAILSLDYGCVLGWPKTVAAAG
jgi:hypothetical protein